MAFELVIAAKRDPAGNISDEPAQPREPVAPVATIEISGIVSEASLREVQTSIEGTLHNPADTVIVRFDQIACEDPGSLAEFARWIAALRGDGHDVRVVSGEKLIDDLISEAAIPQEAVVDPAQADSLARRRAVDTRDASAPGRPTP